MGCRADVGRHPWCFYLWSYWCSGWCRLGCRHLFCDAGSSAASGCGSSDGFSGTYVLDRGPSCDGGLCGCRSESDVGCSPGGASTPPGALAGVPDYSSASQAAESVARSERTRSETLQNDRLQERLEAEIRELRARASASAGAAERAFAEANKFYHETRSQMVKAGLDEQWMEAFRKGDYELLMRDVARARNEAAIDETEAGKVLRWIERAVHSVGGALGGFLGGLVGGRFSRPSGSQGLRPGPGAGARFEWNPRGLVDRSTGQLFRP